MDNINEEIKMGENLEIIKTLKEQLKDCYKEIALIIKVMNDYQMDCKHEVLVCFDQGNILEDKLAKLYCLNCMCEYNSIIYNKSEIIYIDECLDLFEGMDDYEIVELIAEYYNEIKTNNHANLSEREVVSYINRGLKDKNNIESIKKRFLVKENQ